MSRADAAADDPALFAERTALAWTRSALSLAAIGGLILRAAIESQLAVVGYPLGAVLLAGAVLIWAYGSAAYRRMRGAAGTYVLPAPGTYRAIAAVTVAVAAFALVFALVIVIG